MTLKHYLFSIAAIASVMSFQSCKKEEAPLPPTALEFKVKDHLGNAVSGATVKLYTSETDFKKQTNQFGETHFADASGKVTITGLENLKYFWYVEKDCKNNYLGGATSESPLVANRTTSLDVILNPTGTLKLVSTSNNPYKIFINGVEAGQMDGKATEEFNFAPAAAYSIRVLQVSGYAVTPTDKTYTGTLTCGGTLTTTFPN